MTRPGRKVVESVRSSLRHQRLGTPLNDSVEVMTLGAASVINVVMAKPHTRATKCASCGSWQHLGGSV